MDLFLRLEMMAESQPPSNLALNNMEIDHIAFLAMDTLFAILSFVIGYMMLGSKMKIIHQSVKRVIGGFYILMVIQAVLSAMILRIVFMFRDDEAAQVFMAYKYARTVDMVVSSFIILLFFKFLFSMKRTEI